MRWSRNCRSPRVWASYIARDSDIAGFRLIVNRNSKRFVYQSEMREGGKRRAIYKKLGDPQHVSADEARARALDEQARLLRISDPDAAAGTTFADAWTSYKARMERKQSSPRTIADYEQKFKAHLEPSFGKRALRDIRRADVVSFHERLTREVGPYAANGVCRVAHAIYRHAALALEVPDLPALNPFRAYDLFNAEKPRQTGLSEKELPAWFAKIVALDNPIMREVWVLTALTGLRRSDVLTMRWEHVHKKDGYIEIPAPKGGEERAFKCPLTKPMIGSLERVRLAGEAMCDNDRCKPWVFPSVASRSGHIEEVKNGKLDHSPHALRHSFRNFCAGAGVSTTHSRILMNHKLSADVHSEYMTVDAMFEQLREASEIVSTYILQHLGKKAEQQLNRRLKEQLTPALQ